MRLWRGFHSQELFKQVRHAWSSNELLILCPHHMTDFNFVPCLPDEELTAVGDWDEQSLDRLYQATILPKKSTVFPIAPVLGVFTSGTVSGQPRLVLYTKSNIEASLSGIRSFFEVDRIRKIFCYPQATHTFGLTLGYVQAHLFELELVSLEGKYTRAYHEEWLKNAGQGLLTLGAPTHFHDLISFVESKGIIPEQSYSCIAGGARVSTRLWHQMRTVLNIERPSIGYGATEASPGVTHLPPGQAPQEDGEIGIPIPGVTMKLIEGSGIEFSGPNVCFTYIKDSKPEFPKAILLHDRLRHRPSDGVYIYEGRTELTLNRGGFKLSLELIEETLSQKLDLPSVCVSIPDDRLGEDLGILFSKSDISREKIFETLRENFGQNFNPNNFFFIENLPTNSNLKADRIESTNILRKELNV